MNIKFSKKAFLLIAGIVIIGACSLGMLALFGSGLALWFTSNNPEVSSPSPTRRLVNLAQPPLTSTPLPTSTPTTPPTSTFTPAPTDTPTPTHTPTQPPPPTNTPLPPPTDTPTPLPPTPTSLPTDTPTPLPPAYPFIIRESANYGTNHLNFDVYVAITDDDNNPLRDYRIVGTHSSGLQLESPISAGAWTQNSGAMHYKAGNIKYEASNSPAGVWTLQLVDSGGTPVAEPVQFPFDAANPTWYFLFYERQ